MNVTLPRWDGQPFTADTIPPLVWTTTTLDGETAPVIVCANGHAAFLNHDIDAAGKVTPSILCRTPLDDGSECGWHVIATLEGWPP
jgi:hypothetical protein